MPDAVTELEEVIATAAIFDGHPQALLNLNDCASVLTPGTLAQRAVELARKRDPETVCDTLTAVLDRGKSIKVRRAVLLSGVTTAVTVDLGGGWVAYPAIVSVYPQLASIPRGVKTVLPEGSMVLTYLEAVPLVAGEFGGPISTFLKSAGTEERIPDAVRVISCVANAGVSRHAWWFDFLDPDEAELIGPGMDGLNHHHEEFPSAERSVPLVPPDFVEWQTRFSALPDPSRSRLRSAMDRLNAAYHRVTVFDQAIDAAIALEAALATADGHGEISFRLRLRAALLLGGSVEDRRATAAKVKGLYDVRSAVIHGGTKRSQEAGEKVEEGLTVVGLILRRLMEVGDVADWKTVEFLGGVEHL